MEEEEVKRRLRHEVKMEHDAWKREMKARLERRAERELEKRVEDWRRKRQRDVEQEDKHGKKRRR